MAQMAAYFAKEQGGSINILKLMKLMYLADRESLERFGYPITFDGLVSMEHGPVLTTALNLVNGMVDDEALAQWEQWISDRSRERNEHEVRLVRDFERSDLSELSDADLEVMGDVWKKFGKMTKWQLRDHTHNNCPEWDDPGRSSKPINEKDALRAVGMDDEDAEFFANQIRAERKLDKLLI